LEDRGGSPTSAATDAPQRVLGAVRWAWPTLLLVAAAALALAAHIVEEVAEGDTLRSDRAILLALRHADDPSRPIGPSWLMQTAIDLSALGGFTVLWIFGVVAAGYLILHQRRAAAVWLSASLIGASLFDAGLKSYFHRARPNVVPHLAEVSTSSFPSGHAMISAAAYLSVALMLAETDPRRVGRVYLLIVACVLVVMIGCSRVFLGVHWPSDVAAGWCFGSLWALAVFVAKRALQSPR
jgi:undecaprenyl-diphosphatase